MLFHFDVSDWKSAFLRCFIENWEEIESLKNEKKSWNSPGILFFPDCTNDSARLNKGVARALDKKLYMVRKYLK